MRRKIRFGIIGCSRIAENSTIPAILQSGYAEVVNIGSRSKSKASMLAMKFNCKHSSSYEHVLADTNVDAVYISTPVGLHEENVIAAANAGKHILCEKSSTTSFESAQRMVSESKKNNVRLMEGFMFRFHPSHNKVKSIISDRTLGNLYSFNSTYGLFPVPTDDIRYNHLIGGGVLNDAGCYPICASRMLFGKEPISVTAFLHFDKVASVDILAMITLDYGDGQMAEMSVGYDLYYQSQYTLWGSEGILKLSRAFNIPSDMKPIIYLDAKTKNEQILVDPVNHFTLMVDEFCKEILGIGSADFNFEKDILCQARIMQAARISAKEKRTVNLSEIL